MKREYDLKKYATLLCCLLFLALINGCTGAAHYVSTNSLRAENFSRDNDAKYYLFPSDINTKPDDLMFKEVASQVKKAFAANGMTVVDSRKDADYVVSVDYGVGDERTHVQNYVVPYYGITGYSLYHRPRYGITGYSSGTKEWTTYGRKLILSANELDHSKKDIGKQVWITGVSSRGTEADFRSMLPVLVEVLKKDLASDTKRIITYKVNIIKDQDGETVQIEEKN